MSMRPSAAFAADTLSTPIRDLAADIRQGLVSVNSPIARALIGRAVGDEVEVVAPGGARSFEVLAVRLA